MDSISEQGFHGTPMSMIAKTSGVSTGIIHHCFASKEELTNELPLEIKTETIRAMMVGYSEDLLSLLRPRFTRPSHRSERPAALLAARQSKSSTAWG